MSVLDMGEKPLYGKKTTQSGRERKNKFTSKAGLGFELGSTEVKGRERNN